MPEQRTQARSYYAVLGVHPRASTREIRQAYRQLSKQYHPDTTELPKAIATAKFQKINEAYATLINPERRLAYDQKIRFSQVNATRRSISNNSVSSSWQNSAYLDPTDRPLSAGEIFALLMMGLTLIGCFILAIAIALTRPEVNLEPIQPPGSKAADYKTIYFSPARENPGPKFNFQ